jgi:hypothetical protein
MPIRWNPLEVKKATNMIEELVNKAAEPLEQIRVVAREALKIPNLPQYVGQDFNRLIGEVDRAIGGGYLDPEGRLRASIAAIRKSIPTGAIKTTSKTARRQNMQSML